MSPNINISGCPSVCYFNMVCLLLCVKSCLIRGSPSWKKERKKSLCINKTFPSPQNWTKNSEGAKPLCGSCWNGEFAIPRHSSENLFLRGSVGLCSPGVVSGPLLSPCSPVHYLKWIYSQTMTSRDCYLLSFFLIKHFLLLFPISPHCSPLRLLPNFKSEGLFVHHDRISR